MPTRSASVDLEGLTPEQRAKINFMAAGPWAWACVTADGFVAVFIDRASSERYAAHTHGIVVPLAPAP